MEEKKEKSKECWGCSYFSPLYTKGYLKFDKTDLGRCSRAMVIVDKHSTCENFCRKLSGGYRLKISAGKRLCELLEQVVQLKQIISEGNVDFKD